MYVVAVPATAATCTKFVQPEPVQRSIRTSVCVVELFVQFSRIELRDNAVARRPVVAPGSAGAVTTIDVLPEF